MEVKTIKKSIAINATKEKVWDVLLRDEFSRQWYAEFSEGTHAKTDWQVGSKVIFADHTGNGLVARVVENKPAEILDVEYTGELKDGNEVYDSDMAMVVAGSHEAYHLHEVDGMTTHLNIASDMGEAYFEMMSEAWDRALQQIKRLAESA